MRRSAIIICIALLLVACASTTSDTSTTSVTSTSPPSSIATSIRVSTTSSTTSGGVTVGEDNPATYKDTTTSLAPSTGLAHSLPIDDDWTVISLAWPVQPSCCDMPAVGPASPPGPIGEAGPWPGEDFSGLADGFYDVTVTRQWDPPGVVGLSLRRWVPCVERPDECPPTFPADGVFADLSTEVDTYLALTDDLTVVIQPLQAWQDGGFPNPPQVITGSGTAFYELLSGWCGGYLPERNPENCGVDHAFLDWIWYPFQAEDSIDQIIATVESSDTSVAFPFTRFDDGATDTPCGNDRNCPTAYRGPQGTHLIVDLTLLDTGENWPTRLYGWWTSLEVLDGKPVLFIDAGALAG